MFEKIDGYQAQIAALQTMEGSRLIQIKDYCKIKLTYASNALEGNSLTEEEIEKILAAGLKPDENQMWDYYDVMGHAKAYDYLYEIAKNERIGEEHIKTMHRLLYSLVDAEVGSEQGGTYRKRRIQVNGSCYASPTPAEIPPLMVAFTDWFVHNEDKLHPVEFAAQAHIKLDFIQPFMDGNRRVARLFMNLCLLRKGYTMALIPPALRSEYTLLLEKAHCDAKPFVEFLAARVEETQRDIIRLLKDVQ